MKNTANHLGPATDNEMVDQAAKQLWAAKNCLTFQNGTVEEIDFLIIISREILEQLWRMRRMALTGQPNLNSER